MQGDYAYIGEGSAPTIPDISSPSSPVVTGRTAPLPGIVEGVAVVGDYVANARGGLRIVDVSTPANPTEIGFYDAPEYANDVAVQGDCAYVADGDHSLRVVDVSDPANPVEVSSYNTSGRAVDVVVVGGTAYVADGYGGLVILHLPLLRSAEIPMGGERCSPQRRHQLRLRAIAHSCC